MSCSSSKKLDIEIESLKKEGSVYLQNNDTANDLEVSNINNILLYPLISQNKITWDYPFQNSENLIKNYQINNNYKSFKTENFYNYNSDNYYKKEILFTNDKIIYVDDYANLFILDTNFKLLKKIQLYEKKLFGDYLLKYSLIISNNTLFISDNLGFIIAINLNNYSILWKNNFTVPFLSNLVIYKDSIFVTNSNGKLYSFNVLNGVQNWSFETGTNNIKSDLAYKITISDNKLFFSNDMGDIYAVNVDDKGLIWNYKISQNNYNNFNDLFKLANLTYQNNFLYFSSSFGNYFKLNAINGNLVWSSSGKSHINSILNPDSIITISENTFLLIYEKKTGKILYKKNIKKLLPDKKIEFNNIFLLANKIIITTNEGHFILIDSLDLKKISIKKVAKAIKSNIIIYSDKIFFLGEKGFLYKIL